MQSLAFLSFITLVVSVVAGSDQASSSASAAATQATVVPTDVSSSCASYLQKLDTDTSLSSCLTPLLQATAQITPSSSSDAINTALTSICSSSTESACPDTLFRDQLSSFYTACSTELTGANPESKVRAIYDTLYALAPFRESACSQDSDGKYCLLTLASDPSAAPQVALAKASLSVPLQQVFAKRDSIGAGALAPNATTFSAASIPFMFLTSNTPQATLCSACAQNVLKPYVTFETAMSYAYGLTNSALLGGQKALWSAVSSTCGSDVVANAGAGPSGSAGLSGGLAGGAVGVKAGLTGVMATVVVAFFAL